MSNFTAIGSGASRNSEINAAVDKMLTPATQAATRKCLGWASGMMRASLRLIDRRIVLVQPRVGPPACRRLLELAVLFWSIAMLHKEHASECQLAMTSKVVWSRRFATGVYKPLYATGNEFLLV